MGEHASFTRGRAEQSFDHHAVTPDTAYLSMTAIRANYAKSQARAQSSARLVFDEDAREEFREVALFAMRAK